MLDRVRLFARLASARNVLLAGAGGGYDIFSGLPLYFRLRAAGKTVHLGNLSFTQLQGVEGRRLAPAVLEVTADTKGPASYFPEKYLCDWFRSRGEEIAIQCFKLHGVRGLTQAYGAVVDAYDIDAVVLVDGGTDSLMRGDEDDLGTPEEDIASICAVHQLAVAQRYLVCVGFGIDSFHGVSHGLVLENVAALMKAGAFLGAFSLLPDHEETTHFREATQHVFDAMPESPSIVSSSILSAASGEFGDYHATHRTAGSTLWINPLMSMYWAFELSGVADRCLYLDHVRPTGSYHEVIQAINRFRASLQAIRAPQPIPH